MRQLRALGLRVHAVPTVVTEPLPFPRPDLRRFDWVVVTSATGVEALLSAAPEAVDRPRWAAVGPRTAAALAAHGITAAAAPGASRGVAIAEAIGPAAGRRILLARADAAASDLPDALRAAGATVADLAVYHTVEGPEASRPGVASALADPDLALLVFASGSAVRGLLKLADRDPRAVPAVVIGPATADAARIEGFHVASVADRPEIMSLIVAVKQQI